MLKKSNQMFWALFEWPNVIWIIRFWVGRSLIRAVEKTNKLILSWQPLIDLQLSKIKKNVIKTCLMTYKEKTSFIITVQSYKKSLH